jgi:uncharacterized protein with FMN-binding domain
VRRAILIVVGTAAGTGLLIGAKGFGADAAQVANVAAPVTEGSPPAAPPAASARPGAGGSAPPARGGSAPPARGGSPPAPNAGQVTVTGPVVKTDYGPVQVQISWSNGKITDVVALRLPQGEARSDQLSARAAPTLRKEALAAQSAKIATVSGATQTSEGYRQSLQAALDQARAR